MCGISGIVKGLTQNISQTELEEILGTTVHRGPDSAGTFIHHNVGLAHNRLSLLDLSDSANQPFKDERHTLVFNGEIYNWQSLKSELQSQGIQFRTTSDTEVLFYGLKLWGIEFALKKINGMFAFAWYDQNEQKLTLARDRVGIKPLFYGFVQGQFCFASEIKALSRNLGMDDLNMHYLAQAYYGVYETQRHISPFKQIHQLEPGHLLQLDTKTMDLSVVRWFGLEEWVNEAEFNQRKSMRVEDISEEFKELFHNSVSSMCVADAPMGAFVSGGIDSSIVAVASKQFADLSLFTANVVGKLSEMKDATQLAAHLGRPLNEYRYLSEYFVRDIVNCTWHYDAPLVLFINSVPFSGVAALAREKRVKAVLTGEGADELFLGYPKLLTGRWDALIQSPYALINSLYNKIPGLGSYLKINAVDMQKEVLQQQLNGYKERGNDQRVLDAYGFLKNDKEELRCAGLSVNMIHRHLHSLLWRNDRMGMMHSIESRFPFLDEKLMAFGLNLPSKFKIGKADQVYNWKHPFMMDKAVVRNYGKANLPKKLAYKPKFGFGVQGHAKAELKVGVDFFRGGFWQAACGMSHDDLTRMYLDCDPKLIAKLSSVEIWGSLFVQKQTKDQVQERVQAHFRM